MSDLQLQSQLSDEPAEIQTEVIQINNQARDRALQVALLVPITAGLIGLVNAFRMTKLPDIRPSAAAETASLG